MDDSQTVTSFVGSIIVFVPILYFPILVGATFNKHLDLNFISLSSAVGAVTARIIVFTDTKKIAWVNTGNATRLLINSQTLSPQISC